MDEWPEAISTAEILLPVLVALFGQETVCVKMWGCSYSFVNP